MHDVLYASRTAASAGFNALLRRAFTRDEGFDQALGEIMHIPGWFSETNAAAFWAAMSERRPRTVVEIGSYLGRSTVFLGQAMRRWSPADARLVSIDPHTGDRQQLEGVGLDTIPTLELFRLIIEGARLSDLVDIRVATSDEAAVGWSQDIDLIFVDGWHSYEAVRGDIRNYAPHLTANGLVCFDDYGTYGEVHRAVQDGCAETGLTVYGSVLAQAWAGRTPEPPRALVRGLRYARLRPRRPAD